jgi:hypothetical protein
MWWLCGEHMVVVVVVAAAADAVVIAVVVATVVQSVLPVAIEAKDGAALACVHASADGHGSLWSQSRGLEAKEGFRCLWELA